MPVQWNADADAKVMAAILQVTNLKLSQQHYDAVAKVMGCTPKAIMHRVQKIRKAGAGQEIEDDVGDTTSSQTKLTAGKAALRGRKIAATKKCAARTPSPDKDEENADAALTPPPSTRPKRGGAKRDYAQLAGEDSNDDEEEEHGLEKKVKSESGEEVIHKLRQADEAGEDAELDGTGFFL